MHEANQTTGGCTECPARVVCRCLGIREDTVVDAVVNLELRTLKELRQHTGAGDGCMACHRLLKRYLERYACSSSVPS